MKNAFSKITICIFLVGNVVTAAGILVKHFSAFPGLALLWYILGVAGVTVFAIELLIRMAKSEITSHIAGDLAVRAMLGSFGILLALGWILKQ